ncbi:MULTISPECIES: hypothetical protein [Thalassospira]|uniref:hypothetical protein n=1 Tax=Thalassospira TaxID=168934 RepID=UPI0008DE02AA|nr:MULTISPECIES: hypothetical protein [Thalassospira]MDM7975396.1 hypothetical protein [Thalassospira xiamenensis]OHZ00835.1 hypothetical protein BC440_08245 [Thalassospira sp. MIT1004]
MSNVPLIFDNAIKIQHGSARSIRLSDLPEQVAAKLDPDAPQIFAPRSLPVIVREIARLSNRIVPTTEVYIAPNLRRYGGFAFVERNMIVLEAPKGFCDPTFNAWGLAHTVEKLFHEVWHICSKQLSPELYKTCADMVKDGMPLGDPSYWDTPEERLARCFQHWAMSHWMGWQSVTDDPRTHQTPSAVFAAIYSGYFAQVVAGKEGRAA